MTDVLVSRSLLKRALDVLEISAINESHTDFGPAHSNAVNNKKGVEKELRRLLRPRRPTGPKEIK